MPLNKVSKGYSEAPRLGAQAICEFDGRAWVPVEHIDHTSGFDHKRLSLLNLENDSAYASTEGSVARSSRSSGQGEHSISLSPRSSSPSIHDSHRSSSVASTIREDTPVVIKQAHQVAVAASFTQPSVYDLPELDFEHRDEQDDLITAIASRRDSYNPEADSHAIMPRKQSIFASPAYQQRLFNFSDLAVSEVDVSDQPSDFNLAWAKASIIDAFPKQFGLERTATKPLTSFTLYQRSEETVEMLHVILVLESRKVYWKNLGTSNKKVDRVTTLPYAWAAEADLPALNVDAPKTQTTIECLIGDSKQYSTILCDDHNSECRKCKGLASEDECFACDGTGIFKKKPCLMCSGQGKYFCTACKNKARTPCKNCGSTAGPVPILRQAFLDVTRETVVSPTYLISCDNKAELVAEAKALAQTTIESTKFTEGTLPVAACGIVIRDRGHIVCATDLKTGSRGLFEVIEGMDDVTFKGQLSPIEVNKGTSSKANSIKSATGSTNSKRSSWFSRKDTNTKADDSASIHSASSSRSKISKMFGRK